MKHIVHKLRQRSVSLNGKANQQPAVTTSRMAQSPPTSPFSPPIPACISTGEIAEAITDNARDNFSKVIGLPYFCGGEERSPSVPNVKCIASAHAWIKDLENRTMTNWTDEGRIELAKQYALDSAYTHMTHCATQHKNDWDDVRKAFLDIYPEDRSLPSLISELSSVTRQPRETITELYIRVEGIVAKLESMKPTGKEVYNDIFVSIIVNALPKDFSYILADADMKKPLSVYKKALKYVASHPSLQLHDAAVRKENRVVPVNAVTVNAVTTDHTMYRPQNVRNIHCQRCGRNNHTIQNCRTIECFRCHKWGHFASQCTVKLPPIPPRARPTVTCFTCGVQGHASKDCMNNSRRYTTYQTQKKTPIYHQRNHMNRW